MTGRRLPYSRTHRPLDLSGHDRNPRWNGPHRRITTVRVVLDQSQGRAHQSRRARSAPSFTLRASATSRSERLTLQYNTLTGTILVQQVPEDEMARSFGAALMYPERTRLYLPLPLWHTVAFTYVEYEKEGAGMILGTADHVVLTKERLLNHLGASSDDSARRSW